mmetsp:Transcript_20729/g.60285  ORF Transcript_20729/g.60285 Transcript_20729/m.60285 type:complete len:302 (+) Transcript_20729:825-1730(+)
MFHPTHARQELLHFVHHHAMDDVMDALMNQDARPVFLHLVLPLQRELVRAPVVLPSSEALLEESDEALLLFSFLGAPLGAFVAPQPRPSLLPSTTAFPSYRENFRILHEKEDITAFTSKMPKLPMPPPTSSSSVPKSQVVAEAVRFRIRGSVPSSSVGGSGAISSAVPLPLRVGLPSVIAVIVVAVSPSPGDRIRRNRRRRRGGSSSSSCSCPLFLLPAPSSSLFEHRHVRRIVLLLGLPAHQLARIRLDAPGRVPSRRGEGTRRILSTKAKGRTCTPPIADRFRRALARNPIRRASRIPR